jgi:hypothetical protein
MANRRFIDFPIAASVGNNDIVLIWQDGLNKQTTKATLLQGSPSSLAGLTDVDIASLTNGQILQYNSTTSKWENVDRTDIFLSQLGDVTIVAPSNGQVLVYNSSTSKWENSSGGYVPYTGAVTTVNLGAQSILAGSFVKAGGTAAQFLKANGSVDSTAYGTGTVTSVALTMPTAFTVAGSPITTAGTLAVTGAGTVGQYIRGDGSLADFPATTGGGSSVSYYLNGSVSQGTIGGVAYRELNRTPVFGAGTDITINADGYIASFITDAGDPNKLLIPAGNWNFETYFSANSGGGSPTFYVELYKYNGTTFTLIATSSGTPELIAFGTNINPYFSTLAVPETVLALTDRLAVRFYVSHSGRTITLHTENGHLCEVITTFTTGLTALNGLTNQVQFFAVGTSGTDFAISSATDTHTFNLPTASATNRGALSSADWTTFNNKTSNLGTVTSVGLSSATSGVTIGSTPVTTSGTITLAIATASGSQNGLLSSTDWTTFNGKQNALTNPVTGTGTSGQVAYFNGTSTITSESGLLWDAANNILGINTITPDSLSKLDVNGQAFVARLAVYDNNGTPTLGTSPMFYSPASGTLAISTNASLRMLISNTGNMQIGSVTPTNSRLLVSGTHVSSHGILGIVPVGNNTATIALYNSSVVRKGLLFADTGFVRLDTDGDPLQLYSNGNLGLQVFANGNIFIGSSPTDAGYKLDVNGTGRFSGALTGTSATFTSTVTANDNLRALQTTTSGNSQVIADSDNSTLLRAAIITFGSTASDSLLGIGRASNSMLYKDGGKLAIGTRSSQDLVLSTNDTARLTISSTGAATFSSSVTANAGSLFNANSGTLTQDILTVRGGGSSGNFGFRVEANNGEDIFFVNNTSYNIVMSPIVGNVLIGTTTDNGAKFQVTGTVTTTGDISLMNSTGDIHIRMKDSSGNADRVLLRQSGTNDIYVGDIDANGGQVIIRSNGTDRVTIASGGSATFSSLGTGTVTATAGTLSTVSDSSYKIEDGFIDSAIDKVISLKPRYFYWNEKSGLPKDIRQLGFYAQEVNQALGEEAANTPQNENTPWGISDRSIIAMLTKAIQELKQEIDTLKN